MALLLICIQALARRKWSNIYLTLFIPIRCVLVVRDSNLLWLIVRMLQNWMRLGALALSVSELRETYLRDQSASDSIISVSMGQYNAWLLWDNACVWLLFIIVIKPRYRVCSMHWTLITAFYKHGCWNLWFRHSIILQYRLRPVFILPE